MFDQDRLNNLNKLRELGFCPEQQYSFYRTSTVANFLKGFEGFLAGSTPCHIAGRVVSIRTMGNIAFVDVNDGDTKVQVVLRKNVLGEAFKMVKYLDEGDHLGVFGTAFLTQAGEKSILASELKLLSKSIVALPIGKRCGDQTFYAVEDPDVCLRHRHIDLVANPDSRNMLIRRSRMVSNVRRFLSDYEGFLEVETPLLTEVAGGAHARTFDTHYNHYDLDMHLRISLEIPLKKLICGDMTAVYEIGRVFRNEGADSTHNPEFTLLEWYSAYNDPHIEMDRVERLVQYLIRANSSPIQLKNGEVYDGSGLFQTLHVLDAIRRYVPGANDFAIETDEGLMALAAHNNLQVMRGDLVGKVEEKLLSEYVEPNLIYPTFLICHHISSSPLARLHPEYTDRAFRFEAYINGFEIANGYAELNDAVEQKSRFELQQEELNKGDKEAHPYDGEFVYALAGGMPPCTGVGIGLDRLAMVLFGASQVRQVLFFPVMKPKN